ncbi:MAG: hypothetical protein NC911_08370 [Candidatus Omnitrophica bacterium]|nr:hypothetical protein [Candidatus Omnitrophota bacterium]
MRKRLNFYWSTAAVLGVMMAFCQANGQQVTGNRDLPAFYSPGSTANVTLNVNVDESNTPSGLVVAETPPSGWAITSSNPPYQTAVGGSYKWVFYGDQVIDRNITYTVSIPPTSTGQQTFSGVLEYLDPAGTFISQDIQGDTITTSTPLPVLAVSPTTLNFGTETTFLPFTITNVGGADLYWQATVNQAWLTITRTSGTLSSGQSEVVTANVIRTGLTSGTHTATINFTSNGGNSFLTVIVIVGSPSPVSSFLVLSSLSGIDLYWTNPPGYTGTIIFRKSGSTITGGPENGFYYQEGEVAGDALCIFKDASGLSHYYDPGLNPNTTYYYQIYAYSDLNYSTALSGFAKPAEIQDTWQNIDPTAGLNVLAGGQAPVNGFGINIPAGALAGPGNLSIGFIDPTQAPAYSNLLQGFNNIYLLLSDLVLLPGQSITLKIPVYQTDLLAAGARKLSELKVYHWPGPGNDWEEMEIIARQSLEIDQLAGYITVRWGNVTGYDYFSLGAPRPVGSSGGGCFIATAAFGSPLAKQINLLRRFRDEILLENLFGKKFVSWYYRHGPAAAGYLEHHPLLKPMVRACLYPLIVAAWLCLNSLLWPGILLISAGAGLFLVLHTKNFLN